MWHTTAPQAQNLLRNQKQGCYSGSSHCSLVPTTFPPLPIEATHDMSSENLLVVMDDPVPVPGEPEATLKRRCSQQNAVTFTTPSVTVASLDVDFDTLVTYDSTLTTTDGSSTTVSQPQGSPLAYAPNNVAYMFEQSAPPKPFAKASESAVGTDVRLSVVNHLCQHLQLRYPSQAAQRMSAVESPIQTRADVRKSAVSRLLAQMEPDLFPCGLAERLSFVTPGTIHRGSSSSGISMGESSTSQSVGAFTPTPPTLAATWNSSSSAAAAAAAQRTRGVAYCIGTKCVHADFWKRLRAKKGIAHYVCQYCNRKWRTISSKIWNPQTGFTEEGATLYNIPLSVVNSGQVNQLSAWQDLLRYTSEKSPAANSRASLRTRPSPGPGLGPGLVAGGEPRLATLLYPSKAFATPHILPVATSSSALPCTTTAALYSNTWLSFPANNI